MSSYFTHMLFIGVRDFSVDSLIVLDVLESLVHETSIATLIAIPCRAVN